MDSFLDVYPPDGNAGSPLRRPKVPKWTEVSGVQELIRKRGGGTFGGGIVRILDLARARTLTSACEVAFPYLTGDVWVFASDWLGRAYCVQKSRISRNGEPLVLLIDISMGETLEVPETLSSVFDGVFVEEPEACFERPLFDDWCRSMAPPDIDSCAGAVKPGPLGGRYDLPNLQPTSMVAQWGIMTQLLDNIRRLPPGTRIRDVRFE